MLRHHVDLGDRQRGRGNPVLLPGTAGPARARYWPRRPDLLGGRPARSESFIDYERLRRVRSALRVPKINERGSSRMPRMPAF